jgi:hypothetical protein
MGFRMMKAFNYGMIGVFGLGLIYTGVMTTRAMLGG